MSNTIDSFCSRFEIARAVSPRGQGWTDGDLGLWGQISV